MYTLPRKLELDNSIICQLCCRITVLLEMFVGRHYSRVHSSDGSIPDFKHRYDIDIY